MAWKVLVRVKVEDDEYLHELDGVLYPDKIAAINAQAAAIIDDNIEDKFDITGWEFEEVQDV